MNFKHIITDAFAGAFLLLLGTQSQAAVVAGIDGINAFADTITGVNGTFYNWESTTTADTVDITTLRSDLTDTVNPNTYVFSTDPVASIDFAFSSNSIYNTAGADLVLFFVGNTFQFGFDADAGGSGGSLVYDVIDSGYDVTDAFGTWALTYSLIDLDDFGFAANQQLGEFSVIMGGNLDRPSLSLIGGFNTQPVVVPLPLPILLFASGLGALGLLGRRKAG